MLSGGFTKLLGVLAQSLAQLQHSFMEIAVACRNSLGAKFANPVIRVRSWEHASGSYMAKTIPIQGFVHHESGVMARTCHPLRQRLVLAPFF